MVRQIYPVSQFHKDAHKPVSKFKLNSACKFFSLIASLRHALCLKSLNFLGKMQQ